MKTFYFISSFGLIEKSDNAESRTIRDLKACGNYYETEDEARAALGAIKLALAKSNHQKMRNVRIGDWFNSGNSEIRITASNIASGIMISAIPLTKETLIANGFALDGGSYVLSSTDYGITAEPYGKAWKISIHTVDFVFAGVVSAVHELQHLVADCYLGVDVML